MSFSIREVALDEIPGIEDYQSHFSAAMADRRESPQGPAEIEIIARIASVLARDRTQVLLCRDNGLGLTTSSMSRLLTEGNTDKADVGAGAFGVGHLTAFAASDLRYVLYAGRSNGGNGMQQDVASAHAILASRAQKDALGRVRAAFGAHGFLLARNGTDSGSDQLGLFDPVYPAAVPDLLRTPLEELRGRGTVVCIAGFNRFRDDDEDPVDAIARVAAKNFLVAIQRRAMIVEVCDETAQTPRRRIVDDNGLRALLRATRSQQRTRRGWLPGQQAYRCLRTLQEGEQLGLTCGAKAYVRRLDPDEGTMSRVQLFRNGMWITNRADELTSPHFAGYVPFDAAVVIKDGELGTLVRRAEGPEHRGLDRRRLASIAEKRQLLNMLRKVKEELQQHAGKIEQSREYTPADFAIFGRRGAQLAEKVAPYRPRRVSGEDSGASNATTPRPSGDGDAKPIDPPGTGKGGGGRGAKPKPGKSVPGRASIRAIPNGAGQIDTLRVYWRPEPGRVSGKGRLAVRVRIPSGSDETCELPLGPRWLRIKEIHTGDHAPTRPLDPYEAPLPTGELDFTLTLASPLVDARAIEVDVVRRADRHEAKE
ncbi:hypothetical protein [Candidatus Palauibacter sp.]|uniref:hypothetical protein n=1 Tax=Candidatus Palauibacter sp. TaxID=3101350 RepID=UPI003B01D424